MTVTSTAALQVNFDGQIFSAQPFGGISRYFASLAKEMNMRYDVRPTVVAPWHINSYLSDLPAGLVRGHSVAANRMPRHLTRIGGLLAGAVMTSTMRPDILHKTYYYPLPSLSRHAKTVLTVYDMIHEKFPGSFSARDPIAAWKKRAIASADQIICISDQTRLDLLEFNPQLDAKDVAVTHLGIDPLDRWVTDEPAADFRNRVFGNDRPYLLFVGSRAGYKNFGGLLAAYQSSTWLRSQFNLLCFGGGNFTESERQHISAGGTANHVFHIGGADAVLSSCYRHAALFVYPSLYEGFGIPPLEAMSLDCPVACSHTSSIPEVVGDAAAFFDPSDMNNIRTVLENTMNSQTTLGQLVERGRHRRTRFTWRRCAEETVAIYRQVLAR